MKRLTTFYRWCGRCRYLRWMPATRCKWLEKLQRRQNIERRVDSVLQLMTLEEKVGQMAQYSCNWDVTGPVMTGIMRLC